MSEDNTTRLKSIVSVLAVIYIVTFLGGFLQDTQYNFVNYIFFSLLFIAGIGLMNETVKATQTKTTKGFLFLTGTESPRENRRAFSLSHAAMADSSILS